MARHESLPNRWLHRFAVITAIATWFLVVAGALVTSNDAGLAVPDWPLSYGTWMPPMIGGILYEHSHRIIAAFVGLLTIILAAWLWRVEPRRWVRRLGGVALFAIVAQGILGGITVLFFLPPPVSIAHACLAQLFFCTVVTLAWVTSSRWHQTTPSFPTDQPDRIRLGAVLTVVSVFFQLLLGAMVRHKVVGIAAHLGGAVVVVLCASWMLWLLARALPGDGGLRRISHWLLGLMVVQVGLGGGSYWARWAARETPQPQLVVVILTVLHVAVGALVLALSIVLLLQTYRWLSPAGETLTLSPIPQKVTP